MNIDLLLCILGMALVTLIPRVMPVTLLAGRELPPLLTRWLSFVPVSVLAALVAPDLLLAVLAVFLHRPRRNHQRQRRNGHGDRQRKTQNRIDEIVDRTAARSSRPA